MKIPNHVLNKLKESIDFFKSGRKELENEVVSLRKNIDNLIKLLDKERMEHREQSKKDYDLIVRLLEERTK